MNKLKITILLSYISIASASAVIINPALPHIATQLSLASGQVEWLVSIFLIGYVIGQIVYGPIAKRYGDATTLRISLCVNLVGIIICLFGGQILSMQVLLIGRFISAIGSSAGLVCTFIILNNSVDESTAKSALSFVTVSFKLSVSMAVLIGGVINTYSHWNYCFYALLIHGLIMLGLSFIYKNNKGAGYELSFVSILENYREALGSPKLIIFSLTIGVMTVFSYCYSVSGAFITSKMFGFSSAEYGIWNTVTMVGIVCGSIIMAKIINKYNNLNILTVALSAFIGLFIVLAGLEITDHITPVIFFVLITLLYFVCNFIYPAASHFASNAIECKSNASGAMNFVNMSTAVVSVSALGYLPLEYIWSFIVVCLVLPIICLVLLLNIRFIRNN